MSMFKELYNKLLAIKKIVLQNFLGNLCTTNCQRLPSGNFVLLLFVPLDPEVISLFQAGVQKPCLSEPHFQSELHAHPLGYLDEHAGK